MTAKAEAMAALLKELDGKDLPIYLRAMLTVLMEQNNTIDERLQRVESMLAYQLGSTPREVVVAPNLEQARQLVAMGQKPWAKMKRATNDLELWREGWEREADKAAKLKALERAQQLEQDSPKATSDQAQPLAAAQEGGAQP